MPELSPDKTNRLNPVIGQFDEQNGLLEYVHAQTLGAPEFDRELLTHDVVEAYFGGIRIAKKEQRLNRFVHDCGQLAAGSEILRESPIYKNAAKFAGADTADTEASGQLDGVIRHFGAHTRVFDTLYGPVYASKSAKKPNKHGSFIRPASVELPADFPADRVPLRKRDLPPRPEDTTASVASEAFLNFAASNNGFRFGDAKKARALKRHFDEPSLKRSFVGLKIEAVNILRERGVEAGWEEFGKASGKRYFITKERVEPVTVEKPGTERLEPPINRFVSHIVVRRTADTDETNERTATPTELDAGRLLADNPMLETYAREYIEISGGPVVINALARKLVDRTDGKISFNEARRAIGFLLHNESLYRGPRQEGMSTVSNIPIERVKTKSGSRRFPISPDTEKPEDQLVPEEKPEIQKVLGSLRNTRQRYPGLRVSNLVIDSGIEEERLRPFVNKLVRKGVLERVVRNLPGGARSRSKQTMFVAFKNQSLFDRYKNDPEGFIDSLFEE